MLEYIHIDQKAVGSDPTILLSMSRASDRKLIKKNIPEHYAIIQEPGTSPTELKYDLCITDLPSFKKYRKEFLERKNKALPAFLPLVLLVENSKALKYDPDVWTQVDDVIEVPIPIKMLNMRINNQMRNRKNSLKIARQNEKLRILDQAVNSTDVGIVITNAQEPDNPITFSNDGFTKLTGYSREEILGNNCRFLQQDDRNQDAIGNIRQLIQKGETGHSIIRNYKKDGTPFWNELSIAPIKDSEGEVSHFIGIQNDVTQLIETQKDLKDALDEKNVLLQEIHHRVKNNLAVISGLLQIQQFSLDDEHLNKILGNSISRIKSMALIHEKLYRSKSLSHLEFREYIADLVSSIKKTQDYNNKISIHVDCDDTVLNVNQAVPCALILNEAISNAIEHAFVEEKEKGAIWVSFKEQKEKLHVSIKDNGIGIPKKVLETKQSSMGLTIIKTLIKQLGAEKEIKNDNGTELIFSFIRQDVKGAHNRFM